MTHWNNCCCVRKRTKNQLDREQLRTLSAEVWVKNLCSNKARVKSHKTHRTIHSPKHDVHSRIESILRRRRNVHKSHSLTRTKSSFGRRVLVAKCATSSCGSVVKSYMFWKWKSLLQAACPEIRNKVSEAEKVKRSIKRASERVTILTEKLFDLSVNLDNRIRIADDLCRYSLTFGIPMAEHRSPSRLPREQFPIKKAAWNISYQDSDFFSRWGKEKTSDFKIQRIFESETEHQLDLSAVFQYKNSLDCIATDWVKALELSQAGEQISESIQERINFVKRSKIYSFLTITDDDYFTSQTKPYRYTVGDSLHRCIPNKK